MSVLNLKNDLRDMIKTKNGKVKVSLLDLSAFFPKTNLWAWYQPLKDEPSFIDKPTNKSFCSPVCSEKSQMTFYADNKSGDFSKNSLGVLEPKSENKIEKNSIDLMLIPGQAFNMKGDRLGRGMGYYDRYLNSFKGIKVGVCSADRFLYEPIPVENHDVSVDLILTENFLYQPNNTCGERK